MREGGREGEKGGRNRRTEGGRDEELVGKEGEKKKEYK